LKNIDVKKVRKEHEFRVVYTSKEPQEDFD
jgi:hypothetical protein